MGYACIKNKKQICVLRQIEIAFHLRTPQWLYEFCPIILLRAKKIQL